MVEYLVKASLVIGMALLFYKLILQQESFFSTNRWYFICCLGLAFIIPLINLPQIFEHQGLFSRTSLTQSFAGPNSNITPPSIEEIELKSLPPRATIEDSGNKKDHELNSESSKTTSSETFLHTSERSILDLTFLISGLYVFGALIFLLNLLFQTGNILFMVFKSKDKIRDGAYIIINTNTPISPCSFFNFIFIYPDEYDFETYEQIIAHEKIHARKGHSWDLLVAELVVIVLWFNPFIWLYKNEMEKNLEFQTDSLVLEEENVDKSRYQLNLLQIATPNKPLSITTNYNQSLIKQRIMMMNAKKSTINSYWKYAFIAPVFMAAILLLNEPVNSKVVMNLSIPDARSKANVNSSQPKETWSLNINEGQGDMSEGYWYSHTDGNDYCIDFKGSQNNNRWSMSDCFDKSLFEEQEAQVFVMTRETGTLKLMGELDKEVSQGKYKFTKDSSFEEYLSGLDIKNTDENFMFHMFLNDVDKDYVDLLKRRYDDLDGETLLGFAIHDVNVDFIAALDQVGFKDLHPDQVMAAKIHDVNPSTIKEIKALGFEDLDFEKVLALKIHEIDAEYLKSLQDAGYKGLTLDETMAAKIHGLTPSSIKEIKSLDFENLDFDQLVALKMHDISADFIRDFKAAGFDDLSIDEVIEAKMHGLTPTATKEFKSLGFGDLSMNKMMELQIHGVDANFIKNLKDAGYKNLNIDQIIAAKIHNVDPANIKEMEALGFKNLSFEKIIEANIHGVDAAYLNDLQSVGFPDLDINTAINAKIHGVDSDFIKEAKSKGYNLKTLDEYINIKIHGLARNSNQN